MANKAIRLFIVIKPKSIGLKFELTQYLHFKIPYTVWIGHKNLVGADSGNYKRSGFLSERIMLYFRFSYLGFLVILILQNLEFGNFSR